MSGRPPQTAPARMRFERRAARVRRRPLRLALAGLLAVALLAGLTWVIAFSPALAATSVRVEGVQQGDESAVLDAAKVPLGTPLVRLDTAGIAERVRGQVRLAKQVAVYRSLPQTVVVEVVPRTALLAVRSGDGLVSLVDEDGVSFRDVDTAPTGLPVVESSAAPDQGGLVATVEVLRLLSDAQRATVSDLSVSGSGRVTFRLGKVEVVWGGSDDGPKKLAVLNALLKTDPAHVDVSAPDTPVTR
ncbi:MAG: cell division protein FtsQ/DivIB [Dermatophilaceae bacterium]